VRRTLATRPCHGGYGKPPYGSAFPMRADSCDSWIAVCNRESRESTRMGNSRGQVSIPALNSGRYGKPPYELVLAANVRRTSESASHIGYPLLPLRVCIPHSCEFVLFVDSGL